jgi:hypothetical protein
MHDNDDLSIKHKPICKKIMDSIKLSIRLFQGGMRENGLEMWIIKRLDGMSIRTRLTLFS